MNFSPNRVVAIATPLLFAPLAGSVTALAAKYAPGLDIDEGQLTAVFIAGATIALAKAGLWMKGWQDWEKTQEVLPADALEPANAVNLGSEPDIDEDPEADDEPTAESVTGEADLGAEDLEDEPDDLMDEIQAALAEADSAAAERV